MELLSVYCAAVRRAIERYQLTHDVMDGRYDGLHEFEFGLELILARLDRFLG